MSEKSGTLQIQEPVPQTNDTVELPVLVYHYPDNILYDRLLICIEENDINCLRQHYHFLCKIWPEVYLNQETNYRVMESLLYEATRRGQLEIIQYLISIGAQPDFNDNIVLGEAVTQGRQDIVAFLLASSPQVDVNDCHGRPLRNAITHNHPDLVKYLINQGADPRICNDFIIALAAAWGHYKIVQYLESLGCNPFNCHLFPLVLPAIFRNDDYQTFLTLLELGLDPMLIKTQRWLVYAIQTRARQIAELLITTPKYLGYLENQQVDAIMIAARSSCLVLFELLFISYIKGSGKGNAGDNDFCDKPKKPPLDLESVLSQALEACACNIRQTQVARYLIGQGANPLESQALLQVIRSTRGRTRGRFRPKRRDYRMFHLLVKAIPPGTDRSLVLEEALIEAIRYQSWPVIWYLLITGVFLPDNLDQWLTQIPLFLKRQIIWLNRKAKACYYLMVWSGP
jgi:ankyrin repeat protein